METNKKFSLDLTLNPVNPLKLTDEERSVTESYILSNGGELNQMKKFIDSNPSFRDKVRTDVFLNSVIGFAGLHTDLDNFNNLKVSYLDYGWDSSLDWFTKSVDQVYRVDSSWLMDLSNIDWNLKTVNLAEYYNNFCKKMKIELNKIFGYSQDCYLGFCEEFIVGFDVEGGSVITIMPISDNPMYEVIEIDSIKDRYLYQDYNHRPILFLPGKTFYGNHESFYNTTGRIGNRSNCAFADVDIRLD